MCQDFATESGYEYIYGEEFTGTPPWIGVGALMAELDDGTITHSDIDPPTRHPTMGILVYDDARFASTSP
jgi:hypothetical protein